MPKKITPHQGYHWNGSSQHRFFEGWYYRVTLPELGQSFAFMYAIDDPLGNTQVSGGSIQVLGIDDQHLWRTLPNAQDFFASRDRFLLEHWGKQNRASEGYRASDRHNQGKLSDPVSGNVCTWDYQIQPLISWGNPRRSLATMGFWSFLPIFEPGWQILQAQALATGAIAWQGQTYEFENAPAYMEKNWGGAFPQRWFWLQCNSFAEHPDLSITVAGGIRQILGKATQVAMVGIHYQGRFYSFMPAQSTIHCQISPWGDWQIQASNAQAEVRISAKTKRLGTYILVPTAQGLEFQCRDTGKGTLELDLGDRGFPRNSIRATGELAALEVGGQDWQTAWHFSSAKI